MSRCLQPPLTRQRSVCGWVGVTSVVQRVMDLKIPLVNYLMGAVLEGSPRPARFYLERSLFQTKMN